MFKDDEVNAEVYQNYNELINLLKQKGTSSSKLDKLNTLLEYFYNNYERFNKEELKLVKNAIIIASGIANKANGYYAFVNNKKNTTISLTSGLIKKQKELKK